MTFFYKVLLKQGVPEGSGREIISAEPEEVKELQVTKKQNFRFLPISSTLLNIMIFKY